MPERVLITESAAPEDVVDLRDYVRDGGASAAAEAATLLFQLLYTIEVFYRVGLRHVDLHDGNVLMIRDRRPRPVAVHYVLREGGEVLPLGLPATAWTPRVFDYDRSIKRRRGPRCGRPTGGRCRRAPCWSASRGTTPSSTRRA